MSFLSSESVKSELHSNIEPFNPKRVEHGAYEMGLGRQVFTTDKEKPRPVWPNETITVRPGQMAILLTEEELILPNNIVGFISIKAGIKFKGLINISGFHVDPGYVGHLKFSVYNAGTDNILLRRKDPTFLVWFSYLDQSTGDTYQGKNRNTDSVSSDDAMRIQGGTPSPHSLEEKIKDLRSDVEYVKKIANRTVFALIIAVISLLLRNILF